MQRCIIDTTDYTMRVPLTSVEVQQLNILAQEKCIRWERATNTPYKTNSLHTQFIGLAGELSVHILMQEFQERMKERMVDITIDPAYKDVAREGESDIIVNGVRCEVKTVKWIDWITYGPCVTSQQLSRIEAKADVIIWVVFNEKKSIGGVMGYTLVNTIRAVPPMLTGIPGRMVMNHCLRSSVKDLNVEMFMDFGHYVRYDHHSNRCINVPHHTHEELRRDYVAA